MGRRTVTQYANQLKRVLSPTVVNDLGREVDFCFRERVITPYRLVLSRLASHATGSVQTLADMQRHFNREWRPAGDRSAREDGSPCRRRRRVSERPAAQPICIPMLRRSSASKPSDS